MKRYLASQVRVQHSIGLAFCVLEYILIGFFLLAILVSVFLGISYRNSEARATIGLTASGLSPVVSVSCPKI